MQLFFHDVGLKGAETDFPKTVFGEIDINDIVKYAPAHLKEEVKLRLEDEFPEGFCNAWGVPAGAKSVVSNLSFNDVMLLIKTTGGLGEMPALCQVKAFWREELPELSNFLWGSGHFPFVFFFKTQKINLSWFQFKLDVKYMPKFRPSGNVYRVKDERLTHFGGVKGYVSHLLNNQYTIEPARITQIKEPTIDEEFQEGERKVKESSYFQRNPKLVKEAKNKYGYICQACGFDFEKTYGLIGKSYIECHHLNPLSERDDDFKSTIKDVCMLCSNCHRMIHRTKPALTLDKLRYYLKFKD